MESGIAIAFNEVAFFSPLPRRPSQPRKDGKQARRSLVSMIGSRLSQRTDQTAAWMPRLTNNP